MVEAHTSKEKVHVLIVRCALILFEVQDVNCRYVSPEIFLLAQRVEHLLMVFPALSSRSDRPVRLPCYLHGFGFAVNFVLLPVSRLTLFAAVLVEPS